MGMSREQMDRAVNEHFGYEAADDLDGVMASLADDVEHEIVPSPVGAQTDKAGIRAGDIVTKVNGREVTPEQTLSFLVANIRPGTLFKALKGDGVTPIKRYYGEDFLIDETLWNGEIFDGGPFLCDGRSGKASFRLLHIFEFRDGKISREQAWCDLAAIQRQLGAARR